MFYILLPRYLGRPTIHRLPFPHRSRQKSLFVHPLPNSNITALNPKASKHIVPRNKNPKIGIQNIIHLPRSSGFRFVLDESIWFWGCSLWSASGSGMPASRLLASKRTTFDDLMLGGSS